MENKYKVFSDTKTAFERMFFALENAKKSIYVETYKIDRDRIGTKVLDILIAKSENVKTELMVDYWGTQREPLKRLKRIKDSRLSYILFNPLHFRVSSLNVKRFFERLHVRNHRKLIIIDEKTAFVGGMNFNSEELKWKDLLVEIKGPIVSQLISTATEMKNIASKLNIFEKRPVNKKLAKEFNGKDLVMRQIPASKYCKLRKSFFRLLDSAKEEILFTTPYLILDIAFISHLRKAVKRGVKVKIIIPNKCDQFAADVLNKWFAFLKHNEGTEVYLYKGMTHAKYAVVDGKRCTFGSSNMDYQTWLHNYELNIMSSNEKLSHDLKKMFNDTLKNCERFTNKMWWWRSPIRRLLEPIARLFKKHF